MAANWYYAQGKERVGPVEERDISTLYGTGQLNEDSYVWRKGFKGWEKLREVTEFSYLFTSSGTQEHKVPSGLDSAEEIDWEGMDKNNPVIFIKIGRDRGQGGNETEYGPYSINQLKRAYNEKRINDRSYAFTTGMANWVLLGDSPLFALISSDQAVNITDQDRRQSVRRPVTSKIIFHDNRKVFDGICRDISVGGMQILVNNFSGQRGESVTLNVHPDNSEYCFTAKGTVVRVLENKQGFSLRFSDLSQEAHRAITSYLNKD